MERLNQDIKEAMKAKDKPRLNALRYLKSVFMENKTSKKPEQDLDVLSRHVKKLKDSLEAYPQDSDMHSKISTELNVVSEYLPKQLSEDDVNIIIDRIISSQENPNIGPIMKELSPQIKGRFDGKKANLLVRNKLS